MDEESLEKIAKLNIKIYYCHNGRIIIGEISRNHPNAVEINRPIEILKVPIKPGIYKEALSPLLGMNRGESLILYHQSIQSESNASTAMKKIYCEYLMMQQFSQLASDLFDSIKQNDILNNIKETNKDNLASQFNQDLLYPDLEKTNNPQSHIDYWNEFLDSWNDK